MLNEPHPDPVSPENDYNVGLSDSTNSIEYCPRFDSRFILRCNTPLTSALKKHKQEMSYAAFEKFALHDSFVRFHKQP